MKTVVIGEGAGASRDAILAVYPRHKALVDTFKAGGEVIGITVNHLPLTGLKQLWQGHELGPRPNLRARGRDANEVDDARHSDQHGGDERRRRKDKQRGGESSRRS
jgi:hypothetical protein